MEKIKSYKSIHFFEEGLEAGGIGEHIANRLLTVQYCGKYKVHAVNGFVPAMTVNNTIKKYGLDSTAMIKALQEDNV